MTDTQEIIAALQERLPLSKVPSNPSPIHFCKVPFAAFTTHRYRFPPLESNIDWWIDVVSFGKSCYYVVATLERPLLLPNDSNTQDSETLKQMLCLEQPAASKVTAYLQRFKPNLLSLIKGNIASADGSSFLDHNPFGHVDTLISFSSAIARQDEEDVAPLFLQDKTDTENGKKPPSSSSTNSAPTGL
jgi:hypothetical protein